MKIQKQYKVLLVICLLVVFCAQISFGSTTGKIAGVVENMQNGMPIPGATVIIEDIELATQTDVDGEYFFINVPPGRHTISVSIIGYQSILKENVRVLIRKTGVNQVYPIKEDGSTVSIKRDWIGTFFFANPCFKMLISL